MVKRRVTAATLLLCLLLTACGAEKPGTSPAPQDEPPAETAALLTVDGREVPAWQYHYWLVRACSAMAEAYGGTPDWSAPVEDGTLAEYVKEAALADTVLYATVERWAAQYGCMPRETAAEDGVLPDLGFSPEQLAQLERVGQLYAALYDLYASGQSGLTPTEEELASYGEACGAVTVERLLVSAGEDREAARTRAAELFSRLNGAEDQAAAFAALAAEDDDPAGPRTVLPGDAGFSAELLDAAAALEVGQCSGILESPEGFSILRRLKTNTAELKGPYFDHLLLQAAEQAVVTTTSEYDALDPAAFWAARQQTPEQAS